MKMFSAVYALFLCLIFFLVFCSDDHGISPLPGNLGVNVIFLNQEVPENTQGVYLFVAPVFPPHAINELYMNPNSLPLNRIANDTVYSEIVLPYGHYEAVGLWWYNKYTISNLADVFTLKINPDYAPFEFDITEENPSLDVDLYANLNRVDRDATIEGTIYFNGPFPANTLVTGIGAYIVKEPEKKVDYLIYLHSMDFSIDENPYHFKLPVRSRRTIEYLAVFWLSDRSGLDNFKTLGFYRDPQDLDKPGKLKLKENETIQGIDIYADWGQTDGQ